VTGKDEHQIRFGCGALLGILIGVTSAVALSPQNLILFVGIVFATAGLTGYVALKHGDRFWYNLNKYLWWWP
jgi:hypothetical protein